MIRLSSASLVLSFTLMSACMDDAVGEHTDTQVGLDADHSTAKPGQLNVDPVSAPLIADLEGPVAYPGYSRLGFDAFYDGEPYWFRLGEYSNMDYTFIDTVTHDLDCPDQISYALQIGVELTRAAGPTFEDRRIADRRLKLNLNDRALTEYSVTNQAQDGTISESEPTKSYSIDAFFGPINSASLMAYTCSEQTVSLVLEIDKLTKEGVLSPVAADIGGVYHLHHDVSDGVTNIDVWPQARLDNLVASGRRSLFEPDDSKLGSQECAMNEWPCDTQTREARIANRMRKTAVDQDAEPVFFPAE